jgi:NAD(P)H dehydrogenase (quinone)
VLAKPLLDASGLPGAYINAACWIMFNLPWFLAGEVKACRRLAMPASSDSARRWISEDDIAAIAALLLSDDPTHHIGRHYLVTGQQRHDFRQVADMLTELVGETVRYADDDTYLRASMGDHFGTLMTYFQHETRDYRDVPVTDTVERLLGRPPVSLLDYLRAKRSMFI